MSKFDWLWRNWNKKKPLWEGLPYSDVKKTKDFLTQQYTEMANKETREALRIPAKLTDSVYKSLEDGKFNLQDVANFIDDIGVFQPGIDGFSLINDENATMPIQERDQLRQSMIDDMPNVPEDDRYDLTDGITGLLSFARIGWRKGYERGRAAAIAEMKAGTLKA